MNRTDRDFLETLGLEFSPSSGEVEIWRVFSRKGTVLMLLPDQAREFREGLSLYYPQRRLAWMMVHFLRSGPVFRRVLKALTIGLSEEGPVGSLRRDTGSSLMGLLLGNPTQKERRALLLFKDEEGNKTDRSCLTFVFTSDRSSPSSWLSPKAIISFGKKLFFKIRPPSSLVDICVFSLEK